MLKHIAGGDAEVISIRRLKILEVTADLIFESQPDLRLGRAAIREKLEAPIGQAQPVE